MRQDNGRGVTILDRKSYTQKCVSILNTSQFRKLDNDPNESLERKVQQTLQKKKESWKKMSIKGYTQ